MEHTQKLDQVRRTVAARFAQLGGTHSADFCETILVREGYYCGRRFSFEDWRAVWFADEEEVKFSDADGSPIDSIKLENGDGRTDVGFETADNVFVRWIMNDVGKPIRMESRLDSPARYPAFAEPLDDTGRVAFGLKTESSIYVFYPE